MLLDSVRRAIRTHHLVDAGDAVVVAVSGGPDSLALLHALHVLSAEIGARLHVAHLNHLLRGEEAAEDARFVREVAERMGLPHTIRARDVNALRAERRVGLEEAARQARHEFLAEVSRSIRADAVAIGHTADDQVETVILHFVRGTGLAGLQGMRPDSTLRVQTPTGPVSLRVVRPLLDVTRSAVEDYCREQGLTPRWDATNLEIVFARNRVRHEAIPVLEKLNPRLREAVLRLARAAQEDESLLGAMAAEAWRQVARVEDDDVVVKLDGWRSLHPSLRTRVLRETYRRLVGTQEGLGTIHLDTAQEALLRKPAGTEIVWPRGVRIRLGYDTFTAEVSKSPAPRLPAAEQPLIVPGRTPLPEIGQDIVAEVRSEPCDWARGAGRHADLDLDAVGPRLTVRRRRPGDRLVPLGMRGEKKLQDVLVDARVPRAERDSVPVVTAGPRVVWVAGIRMDERFKWTPSTRRVLCLRLETGA